MSSPADSSRPDGRTLTYGEAVFEATRSEMARDPKVFVMGQGVDDARGMFGTTLGLHKEFGAERNFDVPLAEDAMTGIGIGAALMGMRPIQVHQRMDFALLCMNQLVNMAAKMSYMFSGAHRVPLVVRAIIGRSWGQGAQHSQAFHSYFMHIPGLRVVAPTTPHDAKGCLIAAIRDDNPVIMIEHRMLHNVRGVVPEESYEIPYGKARILSPGTRSAEHRHSVRFLAIRILRVSGAFTSATTAGKPSRLPVRRSQAVGGCRSSLRRLQR